MPLCFDLDLSGVTLVFDLDGTLIDTAPDLHAALNHCLADAEIAPVPLEAIATMIGDGAKAMILAGLQYHKLDMGPERIEAELLPAFLAYYRAHICDLSRPYPGTFEMLEAARQAGARLAVATNKAQDLAEQVLAQSRLEPYFSAVLGGDKAKARKPDGGHIIETVNLAGGDPNRAVMLGDSHIDQWAALDAGVPFIFVTFGYGDLRTSEITSPGLEQKMRVVDNWGELPSALTALLNAK